MRAARLCLVLLFLPLPCCAAAEPIDTRAIEAAIRQALRAWHVPGAAVGIVRDGKVIYLAGHGLRQMGSPEPITPDTLFPIASCSKSFTTAALAILNDEGKLHWDDPVRKHVPFFHLADPLADGDVRLRDLVCHRTGLAGHDLLWYWSPWTQEEIIRRAGLLPLDQPFRTAFQYQSTMFTVAGRAVASASGRPWDAFVRERLFQPLAMKTSYCSSRDIPRGADQASPHRLDRQQQLQRMPLYPLDVPDAAGSIHSTARDLTAWLLFHVGDGTFAGKRIVSARQLAEVHTPQICLPMDAVDRAMFPQTQQMSYGMAWVIQDHFGHLLWQHAGAIDGFRVHFTLMPRSRLGIVLLANLHQTRMNVALSNSLLELLLELPRHDWHDSIRAAVRRQEKQALDRQHERWRQRVADTQPSQPLAAYAGRYDHPAYGTMKVVLEDDGLHWYYHHFQGRLEHFHFDTFVLETEELPELRFTFLLDGRGEVAGLRARGAINVELQRSKGEQKK
jgi:CubicO group peptidase (beta-lactamase class C family)